jgi:hypothetical protein
MDWFELLTQLFQIVIFPLLGAITLYLISLINAKKKELQDKINNEKFKKYLDMLDETITSCVIATTQTYVQNLKEQGKFDAEAQKTALNKTFSAVMAILSEDAKQYLQEGISDLEGYILNKIENDVATTKIYFN